NRRRRLRAPIARRVDVQRWESGRRVGRRLRRPHWLEQRVEAEPSQRSIHIVRLLAEVLRFAYSREDGIWIVRLLAALERLDARGAVGDAHDHTVQFLFLEKLC